MDAVMVPDQVSTLLDQASEFGLKLQVVDGRLEVTGKSTDAAKEFVKVLAANKAAVIARLMQPNQEFNQKLDLTEFIGCVVDFDLTDYVGRTVTDAEWEMLQGEIRWRYEGEWRLHASKVEDGWHITGLSTDGAEQPVVNPLPPLPPDLWFFKIPTFFQAFGYWQRSSAFYRAALGKDDRGFYVKAPNE